MNVALKTAIIQAGLNQRDVADRTRIPEGRLSAIIHYRQSPRDFERKALAKLLKQPIQVLFPEKVSL